MKQFIIRTCIFCAPIILLVSLLMYVIIAGKEDIQLEDVSNLQTKDKNIIFSCITQYKDPAYKMMRTRRLKPTILVLGTSRTMQISHRSFSDSVKFYNAGGAVHAIHHFIPFLEKLDYNPNILIIGLDQFFFNDKWIGFKDNVQDFNSSSVDKSYSDLLLMSYKTIIKNILNGEIKLPISESQHIGLNAIIRNNGFHSDGTYEYGSWEKYPEKQPDYQFSDTYNRIKNGISRFEYCDSISNNALDELSRLIDYCKQNNIKLVAFIPPYAPTIWNHMMATGKYKYLEKITSTINPLFNNAGYNCYDFSDGTIDGSVDSEYVDGFHGSKVVYDRIISKMQSDSVFNILSK